MRSLLSIVVIALIWFNPASPTFAEGIGLVPCSQSSVFQKRQNNAPDTYYFNKPYEAYASLEVCGADGLPHLPISLNRAVDVAIPFALFLYVAGFIGWSGRAYLIAANKSSEPAMKEIFIDLPLALTSIVQGLLWPLLALKELASGELTAKDDEIPISPR
ncbi:MAG: Photosystem I reaction center subunit III [Pantanalinema sp. GBBB05]|nr:Photosystem I reaction center subunit III [Pantanalinema sp. GBBB05]